MASRQILLVADETLATKNETLNRDSLNFLKCLPLLLSVQDGDLLPEKQHLRLTCRAAKAAVDPYLSTVFLKEDWEIFGVQKDNDKYKAFCRSPVALAAKKLLAEGDLRAEFFSKIGRVPFRNLQEVDITLDGIAHALELVPRQKWDKLTRLFLRVDDISDRPDEPHLNTVWKSFSETNWPLKSLTLDIVPPSLELFSHNYSPPSRNPGVEHAALLLSSFPTLKHLKINRWISPECMKLLAAVPHDSLEQIELGFGGEGYSGERDNSAALVPLAQVKWPRLQELTLTHLDLFVDSTKDNVAPL